MSLIDEQKAKIDWYKDLFKIFLAIIVAISAGLLNMIHHNELNALFFIGLATLSCLGLVTSLIAIRVSQEIKKLRDL